MSRLSAAFLFLFLVTAGCANSGEVRDDDAGGGTPDAASSDVAGADGAGETGATEGDTGQLDAPDSDASGQEESVTIRVATYNVSLYRDRAGGLVEDLEGGQTEQARRVAEVIQRVRPEILLVNEFDRDSDGKAARIFARQYLAVGQNGAEPIEYPHRFVPETNTGVHSGADLNKDGRAVSEPGSRDYGNDAYGYGEFPGQYGMVIYSKYPIVRDEIRSFRTFKWKDMPRNLLPTDWYNDAAVDALRLSSKNHVDVPVEVGGRILHVLASHPTPPSFDGPEDRNGRRNHDEIRLWADYITGGETADYLYDDQGGKGGLKEDARFVLVGDWNNDPKDGDARGGALRRILEHERVQDPKPTSRGATAAAASDGGANSSHDGAPKFDTADFSDDRVGNLRVDYVLPSANLAVEQAGVFWPAPDADHHALVEASDHRPVWVDLILSP